MQTLLYAQAVMPLLSQLSVLGVTRRSLFPAMPVGLRLTTEKSTPVCVKATGTTSTPVIVLTQMRILGW